MKRICGMPGGKVSKTCGCECETPMPENGSLEDLVSWWIAAKRPFFKKMLCFFGEGSLEAHPPETWRAQHVTGYPHDLMMRLKFLDDGFTCKQECRIL